jgi:IPT/TIG domain
MINAYGGISEDKIVSSTGSYNATATLTSGAWVMQMATFRASGQGSTGNPAPTVSSIAPSTGPGSGGTAVTITGTGFQAGATVSLAGTAASSVVVGSSTTITATTAAHTAGAVNVVVTNSDSQRGTLPNGYTYGNPAPTVSSIAPSSGPASGGTAVTITGTGFLAGATVSLGGTAASSVVVGSSTTITATTAAHAAGAVNVVVTNSDSQSGTLPSGYSYNATTGGTISYVQGKSTTLTSGSSEAIAFSAAQTAGDLNVVAVMWGDATSTVSSVTDSKGNTYALAVGPTKGTGLTSAIYYAKSIASGSNTVTVKFNRTAGYPNVNVLEYSGLDVANPLDVSAGGSGSGTTATSGSAATTSANELIVGAGNPSSVFTSAGSGFSSRMINAYGGISEDKIVSSTGSYNATATLTSGAWVMQMATFRASAP